VRFFAAVPNLKHRIALMTAYAAGLRVSEVVRLKLTDIDGDRMPVRVNQGKGGSDRYIMLSSQLLTVLRTYWREVRPAHWLFPGQDDSRPLDPSVLQWACRNARAAAKLGKPVTVPPRSRPRPKLCVSTFALMNAASGSKRSRSAPGGHLLRSRQTPARNPIAGRLPVPLA
jgi:integrase